MNIYHFIRDELSTWTFGDWLSLVFIIGFLAQIFLQFYWSVLSDWNLYQAGML